MQEDSTRQRTIRSFVRRSGRLTPSQKKALDELWPTYGLDFSPQPIDFASVFQRTAPIVFEIGFGNGETFVQQASENPEQDFLGVEVHEPGVGHCLLTARNLGISNLRVIVRDAIDVLSHQLPEKSVSRLNLYFPDPWPKKRHHKRRILQESFLKLASGRLINGGTLHVATDWSNYAEHIDELFASSSLFRCKKRREHRGDCPLDRPRTKFEARGLRRGHRIYDWCFKNNVI